MPAALATIIFVVGIAGLFHLDRDERIQVSRSLWIPTVWLFFCLSRSFAGWMGESPVADRANTYVEGSPVDAGIFLALEIAALIVLTGRRQRVVRILRNNWAICLFFFYAALSIAWSDYSFVTLKHWIKGVGDLMMVLIVLTEPKISEAINRLFTRLAFLLLPLSVLFIKYYPLLGRRLNLGWEMEAVGVSTQKNGLGALCAVLGLALLWRLRNVYNDREDRKRKRRMVAIGAVLVMVVWLLSACNSMTSISSLIMAGGVMFLMTRPAFRRRRGLVHVLAGAVVLLSSYALFFQSSGSLIQGLGRNATLTGRTEIWHAVLSIPNHRLLGAGYESFWLGYRLEKMWDAIPGLQVNESHNGYIEILISLGWIGAVLLGILIVTGYQNVIAGFRRDPDIGSLRMAFFLSTVVTGFTEAAFRMLSPQWIVFLLAIIATPVYTARTAGHDLRLGRRLPRPVESPAVPEETSVGY